MIALGINIMMKNLSLEEFLSRNRINSVTWEKAKLDWSTLQAIATDHEMQSGDLESAAELFANLIQKFNRVHSVRWRVKNAEHLAEKIVRKRCEDNPKYKNITLENYFEYVTDLVGIRALHLLKEDCFEIDNAIKSRWNTIETTVAYIRQGDSEALKNRFVKVGFEVKEHPAGYRSIHYVIESSPVRRKIIAEIQVRTIFEEGWSEIDHKVRYPNFSNNDLVNYFLEIFNRMAGSADDMGAFVQDLVAKLANQETIINDIKIEKEAIFRNLELTLSQMEHMTEQGKESKEHVAKLKAEIEKLKEASSGGIASLLDYDDLGKIAARGLMSLDIAESAAKLGSKFISKNIDRPAGLMSLDIAESAAKIGSISISKI